MERDWRSASRPGGFCKGLSSMPAEQPRQAACYWRARTRFHRAQRRHQAAIDAAWATSEGTCTYLGEWHTHPEPIPTPSPVDWADWRRRLLHDHYTEPLFFIIVGTTATRAWEGRRPDVIVQLTGLIPCV